MLAHKGPVSAGKVSKYLEIALQVEAMAMELMGAMEMDLGMNKPVCNAFFALQSQREPPATGWD